MLTVHPPADDGAEYVPPPGFGLRSHRFPGMKSQLTTRAWALIPVGVGINVVGGVLVTTLRLPLYLDSIGTALTGIIAGPWVGAVTGVLTNLVLGVTANPTLLPYAVTSAFIGLGAGFMARWGMFRTLPRVIVSGLVMMLIATLVTAPISIFVFGGVAGTGVDAVRGAFSALGSSLVASVFQSSFLVEPFDKTASALLAFYAAKSIPLRFRPPFGRLSLPR